jgi:hypothetical protein
LFEAKQWLEEKVATLASSPLGCRAAIPALSGAWTIQEAYDRNKNSEWGFTVPDIGDAYEGGFFAGFISHTGNGVATHGLIVAPSASGYNGQVPLQWKTTNTSTAGTTSPFDGAINSANMNNASHPAAQYCEGLTIGGYSDWYLPARYELDIAYENLKPTTASNNTSWGINPYSVPERTVNRTAGAPAQTSHSSLPDRRSRSFCCCQPLVVHGVQSLRSRGTLNFSNGDQDSSGSSAKDNSRSVRAFRKFAL